MYHNVPALNSFSVICRGESFSCRGGPYVNICVAKRSYCDGIRDCEDGKDEPDSCFQSTLSSLNNFLQDFKNFYGDITGSLNPKSTYGPIFGGIIGIIVLFFSLLILVAVTMTLCVCNKHCPIYKWRQRRGQPPVGVMIAAEVPGSEATVHLNHEPQDDSALIIGTVEHDCTYIEYNGHNHLYLFILLSSTSSVAKFFKAATFLVLQPLIFSSWAQ